MESTNDNKMTSVSIEVEKTEASSSSEEIQSEIPSNSTPSSTMITPSSDSSSSSTSTNNNPFVNSSNTNKSSLNFRSSLLGSSSSFSSNSCAPSSSTGSSSINDSQNKTFVLNPPKLHNPFSKVGRGEEKDQLESSTKDAETSPSPSEPSNQANSENNSSNTTSGLSNSGASSRVSFVPLGWSNSSTQQAGPAHVSSSTLSSSFVFGQNLRDKVEGAKSNDNQTEVSSSTDTNHFHSNSGEVKANGTTSEMLFSSAVKKDSPEVKTSECNKSLSEAAREYEEARSVKRKFEPVQLITGEEHEQNVLQMNCKLFAYDTVSSGWQERGRGLLRLNDAPPVHSRLIIRAHGSLRVLINTKVFSGMVVERASAKSLRITAMDNSETIKVFLISASQTEIDDLQRYLELRVKKLEHSLTNKSSSNCDSNASHTCNKKLKSESTS